MRYSESKTYIWYMIDGLCKLKCKEWQCTWERNWKSYSVRGRLHASTFALQYHLLPLFCPCFWIHVTKSLYFLLSIWLLNDWQEYVPLYQPEILTGYMIMILFLQMTKRTNMLKPRRTQGVELFYWCHCFHQLSPDMTASTSYWLLLPAITKC